MLRSVLLLAAAAASLILSGCGDPGSLEGGDQPTEEAPATSLTITVKIDADAEPTTMTLTCDPAGGDHPQPQEACDELAKAAPDVFKPVPKDQMCTMIYGGPQTATITGTWEGERIKASFKRENGCEIGRWDQLGTTVFDVPLQ